MKFSIGSFIIEKTSIEPNTSYEIEKVIGILDGTLLAVNYGTSFNGEIHENNYENLPGTKSWREAIQRYREEEVFTIVEAEAERHRLQEAQNKLAQDFELVKDQLKSKLDRAAELVREAGDLARAHKKEFYDLRPECMPLYHALKDGGWVHSHMSC
jgi:hypothetical protein